MGQEMLPIAQKQEVVETVELPLLQRIYTSGQITEKDKKEIQELIKSPTEEDKVNLKKILLAHYQQKNDKVGVKKQKEQEVNEFIDNIC
jgi:low affinity Fe/Cu permease